MSLVLATTAGADEVLARCAETVHVEYRRSLAALDESIDHYFACGRALLEARTALPSDQAFGLWFRAQDFGFNQQWAWTLRQAAQHESAVRAAVTTQVVTGAPNIKKAVRDVRAALAAAPEEETVADVALATVTPIRQPVADRTEQIRSFAALGLTPAEIGVRLGISSNRVSALAKGAGIILGKKSQAAMAERIERMRSLARQGATSAQIAGELGVVVEVIKKYGRDHDIAIPADATTVAGRTIDSTRIVVGTIDAIDGIGAMFDHIDFAVLPAAEVNDWLTVLDTSIRSLTTLRKHLKEMSQS